MSTKQSVLLATPTTGGKRKRSDEDLDASMGAPVAPQDTATPTDDSQVAVAMPPRVCFAQETPTAPPRTPDFVFNHTIPRSVIDAMSTKHGVELRKIEGVICIKVRFGDDAHDVLRQWTRGDGDRDPGLSAVVDPQPDDVATPALADVYPILQEVNAILSQYKMLRAPDLAATGHPALTTVAQPVQTPIRYHHASVATHAVLERIARPELGEGFVNFPTIMQQRHGTYLCSVEQQWKGRNVRIAIMKM